MNVLLILQIVVQMLIAPTLMGVFCAHVSRDTLVTDFFAQVETRSAKSNGTVCIRMYACVHNYISYIRADVDECNTEMDICSQVCLNNPGSFMCGCREGFLLDTDGKSCRGKRLPSRHPMHETFNRCIAL